MNKPSILELAVTNNISLLRIGSNWWGYFPFFGHRQWLGDTPKRVHENLTNIINRYNQQCARFELLRFNAEMRKQLYQEITDQLSREVREHVIGIPEDWIPILEWYAEPHKRLIMEALERIGRVQRTVKDGFWRIETMDEREAVNILSGKVEGDIEHARRVVAFAIWAYSTQQRLTVNDPDFCEWVNQGNYAYSERAIEAGNQLRTMAKQWDRL